MKGTKSFLASKTFWGVMLSVLAFAGPKFGLHLSSASTDTYAQALTAIAGAALTMYGRYKADKGITLLSKPGA